MQQGSARSPDPGGSGYHSQQFRFCLRWRICARRICQGLALALACAEGFSELCPASVLFLALLEGIDDRYVAHDEAANQEQAHHHEPHHPTPAPRHIDRGGADALAMHVLTSNQGIATFANAFRDEGLVGARWIRCVTG